MKLVLTLFIVLLSAPCFSQGKWQVVKDNLDYDYIYSCKEGMYKVKKNNKFGFINKAGTEVIPPVYADAKDFANGLAAVKTQGSLWGIIDVTGKWKVKPEY